MLILSKLYTSKPVLKKLKLWTFSTLAKSPSVLFPTPRTPGNPGPAVVVCPCILLPPGTSAYLGIYQQVFNHCTSIRCFYQLCNLGQFIQPSQALVFFLSGNDKHALHYIIGEKKSNLCLAVNPMPGLVMTQ
jgi:hypothetical protein